MSESKGVEKNEFVEKDSNLESPKKTSDHHLETKYIQQNKENNRKPIG